MMSPQVLTNLLNANLPALCFELHEAEDFDQEDHEIRILKDGKFTGYSVQHGPYGTLVNQYHYKDDQLESASMAVTGVTDYVNPKTGALRSNDLIRDIRELF